MQQGSNPKKHSKIDRREKDSGNSTEQAEQEDNMHVLIFVKMINMTICLVLGQYM